MILSSIRLVRPVSFGFGVETWMATIGGHKVSVRRYFGPGLDPASRVIPEPAVLIRLNHPNIQRLLWTGLDEDGTLIQVSDWLDGRTLREQSTEQGEERLTATDYRRLTGEGLAALAYMHEQCPGAPIVHGDLSPTNMIVTDSDDGPGLAFVDIRGLRVAGEPVAPDGIVFGALPYMADEVLRGAPVSPASEIWSFAMSITACAAGVIPWKEADSPNAMLARRQTSTPAQYLEMASWVGDQLVGLLGMMLSNDPGDRPDASHAIGLLGRL